PQVIWLFCSPLSSRFCYPCGSRSEPMYKGGLREDIETIVRVLPRPKMNGSFIVKTRNRWLIVREYGDAEGIVLLNTVTNHEGPIPYDSVREFRKPDMLILRAQVGLGRDGKFSID